MLQNLAKHIFLSSKTLKIGWGALQLPTDAPKTPLLAKKRLFWAIFGQKMRFFGDGGSEKLDDLLQNLTKHVFLKHCFPQKIFGQKIGFLVMVAPKQDNLWGLASTTTDHSRPKNTVLGHKMAFFGHFWAKNAGFLVMVAPKKTR